MRGVAFALAAAMLAACCTGHATHLDKDGGSSRSTTFPAAPTVDCPAPVIPPGRYTANISEGDIPPGSDRAFASGSWTWSIAVPDFHCFFSTSLTRTVEGRVVDIELPFYTVAAPNRVVVHWCCSIPEGTYEVSIDRGRVRLKAIHDDETEFAAILVTEPWIRETGDSG